jgi:hypothetical protein
MNILIVLHYIEGTDLEVSDVRILSVVVSTLQTVRRHIPADHNIKSNDQENIKFKYTAASLSQYLIPCSPSNPL